MNNAEILIKSLEDLGVKYIFGYIGASIAPVFDAIGKSNIKLIINSNEQAAAFSAAGYSRASNNIGVVITTSGPSITNTLTAVADSLGDSIPLIVIAGQVHENTIGTDAFQHINLKTTFASSSKKIIEINSKTNIEQTIKETFFLSKSGKPGPIVIDFPLNIQFEKNEYTNLDLKEIENMFFHENHLNEKQCEEFFDLLKQSKKPLLYIGGGVNSEKASDALKKFNNIFQIPVVNTLMAKGVIGEEEKYSLGMLGMYGTPYANKSIQETDFFFGIGVRWDDRVSEKVGSMGLNATIAYIDINPEKVYEIRKNRKPKFSFIGDATTILNDLTQFAIQNNIRINIKAWQERIIELKENWPLDYNKKSKIIWQAKAIDIFNSIINKTKKDYIITTGVGNHQMLSAQYIKSKKPKSFLTSGSFGTMGFAIPVAIGAYFSNKEKNIIAIDGDGGLKMNFGELNTIINYKTPIKILILNNFGDGMVRNLQKTKYNSNYIGTNREKDINFSKIAKIIGFNFSKRIIDEKYLKESINQFLKEEGPAFLEIITDPNEEVYPIIPRGSNYKEMLLGPHIKERKK
jgi:acetolactate synthase I/II/III large subunit